LEIELTAQAEADLVEIGDIIAKDDPSATERLTTESKLPKNGL
jgi:plasmid stabilization system protein ParE